jgi:hypothetical protein
MWHRWMSPAAKRMAGEERVEWLSSPYEQPSSRSTFQPPAPYRIVAIEYRRRPGVPFTCKPMPLVRHHSLTAASERANRLLAVVCRTTFLPFHDFPHEWVKPRKSNDCENHHRGARIGAQHSAHFQLRVSFTSGAGAILAAGGLRSRSKMVAP